MSRNFKMKLVLYQIWCCLGNKYQTLISSPDNFLFFAFLLLLLLLYLSLTIFNLLLLLPTAGVRLCCICISLQARRTPLVWKYLFLQTKQPQRDHSPENAKVLRNKYLISILLIYRLVSRVNQVELADNWLLYWHTCKNKIVILKIIN